MIVVVLLLVVAGVGGYFWMNSSKTTPVVTEKKKVIKQVDLSTQPEWVQKLDVTITKGKSPNGLNNFTFKVSGMPKGMVSTLSYIAQYETATKGSQGALSTTPIKVDGAETYSKTIDFGTCSTKSCVRHDGVTSVDLELNFTTTSGDSSAWSKSLELK